MKQVQKRIRWIILVILGIVFLSIIIGINEPISEKLQEEVLNRFQLTTQNKYSVLNENLLNIKNSGASLSSRSEIRRAMSQYNKGEITLAELIEFTIPRYEEGFAAFDRARTAARITIDGKLVHMVGPDDDIRNYVEWSAQEEIVKIYPDGIVVVQSPIVENGAILGFDIVLTDISHILSQMEEGGYEVLFLVRGLEEGVFRNNGKATSYMYSDLLDRTVSISMDESQLFDQIEKLRLNVYSRIILIILVIYLIIQFFGINYIRKFVEEQHNLKVLAEESENEKKLLIGQMNQGFILLKNENPTRGQINEYIVADANSTLVDVVGVDFNELKGKFLSQILPANRDECISELQLVVDNGQSKQIECYLEDDKRWWIISAYRPKEGYLAMIIDDITEKKIMELRLKDREETMRLTMDTAGEGLWDWNFEKSLVYHNRKWCDIMGVEYTSTSHKLDEFIGYVHPDDEKQLKDRIKVAISGENNFFSEHRMILSDGREIWIRDRGALVKDDDGTPFRMIGSMADITKEKQSEEEIFLEKEIFRSTLLSVQDGIISTDVNGKITVFNPAAEEITGWGQTEAIGNFVDAVFRLSMPGTGEIISVLSLADNPDSKREDHAELMNKSGKKVIVNGGISSVRLPDGEVTGYVVVFRDITENVMRQKKIEYMSFHDELTGLYNRRYMEDALLRLDTVRNLPFSIMVIDMNNLKITNDLFGHDIGDQIISETAEFLKDIFRADDIISRTGGDEFAILLPKTSNEEAKAIKTRIQSKAAEHKIGPIALSLAVGYSTKNIEDASIEEVLRSADARMYEDKQRNSQGVKKDIIQGFVEENLNKFNREKRHNEVVSILSAEMYKALGKSDKEVEDFREAVELHDIGKIIIPDSILNKKEALTEEEVSIIKRHPQAGYEILQIMEQNRSFAKAILYHHERMDGQGYPQGLVGEEIPLESRIIAIADAYEAMTSDKPYKKGMSHDEAIEELKKNAGTQFDPYLVEVFVTRLPSISFQKPMAANFN